MMEMRVRNLGLCCLLAAVSLAGGCGGEIGPPPHNLTEYRQYHGGQQHPYPRFVILQHNLQRVLDGQRSIEERVESLRLVDHLGGEDPSVRTSIAAILAETEAPAELHRAALSFLMKRDFPDLAAHLMKAWPAISSDDQLRQTALGWLSRNPDPRVLGEVVKLWAKEPSPTGPVELRFRLVVEKISGKTWDVALLDALNTPVFFARGSAMEVLSRRLSAAHLALRVSQMKPKTRPMLTLQFFVDRFGYLPQSREQLVSSVIILQTRRDMLPYAEQLSNNWQQNERYKFDIRDFHLLSGLARDPLRQKLQRRQLTDAITDALGRRQHALNGRITSRGSFGWLSSKLTMVDLWNVYLLNEMVGRPRVQLAVRIMADGDRVDKRSRWGGLIFYENGQAEAKLYTPDRSVGEDDMAYVPTKRLISDGRDSMCRFVAHFEKICNGSLAGPTKQELLDAKRDNYYGLVLTSISDRLFSAHYYNPQGQVVSLGLLPFKR